MALLSAGALLLASCGNASYGEVRIVVERWPGGDGVLAEATVLFLDAQGNTIARVLTTNGEATGSVPERGSVIVVRPTFLTAAVTWVLDVHPGDTLTVGDGFPAFFDLTNAQLDLGPLPKGTERLYFSVPCPGTEPLSHTDEVNETGVYDLKVCGSNFDLLLVAEIAGGLDDAPPQVALVRGVQTDAFHDATLAPAWGPPSYFDLKMLGEAPPGLGAYEFVAIADGRPRFVAPHAFRSNVGGNPDGSFRVPWIAEAGGYGTVEATFFTSEGGSLLMTQLFDDVSGGVELDVGSQALPAITDLEVTRNRIRWAAAGGRAPDGVHVSFGYWDVIAPPGSNRIGRPHLPADLARLWPDTIASFSIEVIDEDGIESWDVFRQLPSSDHVSNSSAWLQRSRQRTVRRAFLQ